MWIQIHTNAKEFEAVNFILSQAIEALQNSHTRDVVGVTPKQVAKAEIHRKKLVKAFLKAAESNKP